MSGCCCWHSRPLCWPLGAHSLLGCCCIFNHRALIFHRKWLNSLCVHEMHRSWVVEGNRSGKVIVNHIIFVICLICCLDIKQVFQRTQDLADLEPAEEAFGTRWNAWGQLVDKDIEKIDALASPVVYILVHNFTKVHFVDQLIFFCAASLFNAEISLLLVICNCLHHLTNRACHDLPSNPRLKLSWVAELAWRIPEKVGVEGSPALGAALIGQRKVCALVLLHGPNKAILIYKDDVLLQEVGPLCKAPLV